jgi:LysR family glycine cleavage system transcriptional activator
MHRKLPPLKALRAFEAAARYSSFTRASEELFVTPTAIRHQVKLIEDWLGVKLFVRSNNSLSLTDKGRELLPAITDSFDRITGVTDKMRGLQGKKSLTISARPNFALRWLVPRLERFSTLAPGVQVRVITAPRSSELMLDEIDAAIYLGEPRAGEHCDLLFASDMLPVCSPTYLRKQQIRSVGDLKQAVLLHVMTSLDDWELWLAAAKAKGVDAQAGPQLDSFALALQGALSGWGVAMTSTSFIQDDLVSGRLVAPFSLRLHRERAYYLACRDPEAESIAIFRSWLIAESTRSVEETAELIKNTSWA